jgi:phenylacetate-CoA ligase
MRKHPLDSWILRKIGASENILTKKDLQSYQLKKLKETLSHVCRRSPFYSRQLSAFSADCFTDLSHLTNLPFTTAEDICSDHLQFLAMPQHDIARIVTLHTSGTTGPSKRLFFTKEDLELTADYFSCGMSILVEPGQKVLILLPGDKPDSVGDLLVRGLKRINVEGIIHGPVQDVQHTVRKITEQRIDCLVGIPAQVFALARSKAGQAIPRGMIKSILLSTDYIPEAIVNELVRKWNCQVFKHYGMTEMGLGGAVECHRREGYHLREADLLFEIVDPDTGNPLKEGEAGEIVITTLTRKGMPLIRYRTGDISHIIPEPCSCGSVTKRIGTIQGRLDGRTVLSNGSVLTLTEMDETLFGLEGLLNYQVVLASKKDLDCLEVSICVENAEESVVQKVINALNEVPAISKGLSDGSLRLAPISLSHTNWFTTGVAKRTIIDGRKRQPGKMDLHFAAPQVSRLS